MATKVMHRILNLETGVISVSDWIFTGCVELNKINIEYDDQLTEAHHQMVLDGIEKRKQALCAEMVLLDQRKQELLCIVHKVSKNGN